MQSSGNCRIYGASMLVKNLGISARAHKESGNYSRRQGSLAKHQASALNQKGQEEAPFELLIAVIIMGFVLFVGMQAMAQLSLSECTGKTEKAMENLRIAIETVATEKGKQNFNFSLPGCFKEEKQEIRVRQISDRQSCTYFCKQLADRCTILYYDAEEIAPIWKCLAVSYLTRFHTEFDDQCPDTTFGEDKYELCDFFSDIAQGNYVLTSKPSALTQVPVVCAYRYKSGESCKLGIV